MSEISSLLSKKNIKIGFYGLGKSNAGVLSYLKRLGVKAEFTLRSDKEHDTCAISDFKRTCFKDDALLNIDEDILFLSPSVKRNAPELLAAKERGTVLSSDAELFFEQNEKDIIAVTGSDGKSTTTYLISSILAHGKTNAIAAGNFGRSLCSLLNTDTEPVAELSSFQLSYCKPKTEACVITNLSPNHLNWHSSYDEYIKAKANILCNSKRIVFDNDGCRDIKRFIDREVFCKTSLSLTYSKLKETGGAENYITLDGNKILLNGKEYADVSRALRKETYNIRNYMLALGATLTRTDSHTFSKAIKSFRGLSHRAELILESNGIKYINSSIDSSPERTLKTLRALQGKIAVIIGGSGKNLSLEALADELPSLTSGAVVMGDVGRELYALLKNRYSMYDTVKSDSMEDSVILAEKFLNGKGTVVLSPAATSFDRYKNFEERGEHFRRIVYSKFSNTP